MSRNQTSPRRRFDRQFSQLLLVSDLAVCSLSVVAAWGLRALIHEPLLAPLKHDLTLYLRALPVVAGLWLIAFHGLGLYAPRRFVSPLAESAAVSRGVTLTVLLVAGASFLSHKDYSRAMLFLFWVVALTLALVVRSALRALLARASARGEAAARALIVGCGDLGRLVARRIEEYQLLGYELVGFVCDDAVGTVENYPVVGTLAQLPELVVQHRVAEVLVAQPDLDLGVLMTAIQSCEGQGVGFHLVAGPLQVLTQNAELSGIADLPVVELPYQPFSPAQRTAKRLLDLALGTVLLVLCLPVLALLVGLVACETKGRPIFRQTRIGFRGKPFTMYKLRTMHPDTDPYAESPTDPTDERVTRLGRWLRHWSLDELPQLFNVIKGDMSLVGPRPEMPFIVAQYEPWQRRRLDVKPGITGLWQVLGRKDLPLRDNIEYDFYYIRNWSVWLDLSILLRTVVVVLGGRGAY